MKVCSIGGVSEVLHSRGGVGSSTEEGYCPAEVFSLTWSAGDEPGGSEAGGVGARA